MTNHIGLGELALAVLNGTREQRMARLQGLGHCHLGALEVSRVASPHQLAELLPDELTPLAHGELLAATKARQQLILLLRGCHGIEHVRMPARQGLTYNVRSGFR